MARESLVVNGLDLMAGDNWDVEDFSPALAPPVGENPTVPGRNGTIWRAKRPGPASFTVTMWIGNPAWTRQQVWVQWENILNAVTDTQALMSVTWTLSDGSTRTCQAERIGDVTPTRIGTKGWRAQLEFTIPAGYWTGGPEPAAVGAPPAFMRLYNSAGAPIGDITQYDEMTLSRARKPDPDSASVTVRRNTPSAALLDGDWVYAQPVIGGSVKPWVFVLDEDSEDEWSQDQTVRPVRASFVGLEAWLDHAIIYPENADPANTGAEVSTDTTDGLTVVLGHRFNDANAGTIIKTLVDRAHARNALADISIDFTGVSDSASNSWTTDDEFDETYTIGSSYKTVIDAIAGIGWCDYRFNGFTLQVYRPGTLGVDRPGVVFTAAQCVQSAPRTKRRMDAKSTMLVHGDGEALYERVDATAVANLGRREGFYRRGGVYQLGTITKLSQLALDSQKLIPESLTLTMVADAAGQVPGADFDLWDTVRWDQTGAEPLRVNTITQRWDAQGQQLLELELLDRISDRADRLRKLLERVRQPDAPDAVLPKPIEPIPTIPPNDGSYDWPGLPDANDPIWSDIGDANGWTGGGGGIGGGLGLFYVQPDEPLGTPVGTGWFDTDEVSVTYSSGGGG